MGNANGCRVFLFENGCEMRTERALLLVMMMMMFVKCEMCGRKLHIDLNWQADATFTWINKGMELIGLVIFAVVKFK